MKRKRQSGGTQPAKKMAGVNRKPFVQVQARNLRFQQNTVKGSPPEQKEITNATATIAGALSVAFNASGATSVLNAVLQGTTAETRIGRKIRMRSIDIRWTATLALTSVGGSPLRVLVVYDKQTNAGAAGAATILNTNDFHSPMNLANSDRFIILKSWLTEPISTGNNFSVSGHQFIKCDLETLYNDTDGGTVADITTGSVILIFAQNGNITTAAPSFTFISRVRFDDN